MPVSDRERRYRPLYTVDGVAVPSRRLVHTVTGWSEPAPMRCCNGHSLLGDKNALVGWIPCPAPAAGDGSSPARTGHRTHQCRVCGATVYTPPLDYPECACEQRTARHSEP
ncbi:hypothetical protein ACWEP5_36735 [Nocardia niigatensis]